MSTQYNLLTRVPHPFSILPPHPSLTDEANRPTLTTFVNQALTQSSAFLSSIPATFHKSPKPRSSPPSTAKVTLATHTTKSDYWVCRTSIHDDAAVYGSASAEEFRSGLREDHAKNEMDYTPSVSSVEKVLEWEVPDIEGWKGVEMHVNVITHTFSPSFLISPRSFIVLYVSADLPDPRSGQGFMTVQVPLTIDAAGLIPTALRDHIKSSAPQDTIFASYASVEQLVSQPQGQLEWTMATTSDAGGAIPQWIQRSWTMGGVPKAVVADVGLFLGWVGRRRKV